MSLKLTQRLAWYAVLAAVFVFAIYSNVRRGTTNYQLRQTVSATKTEVESLKQRNEKLKLLLTFYQTAEYQEVEAKRRLGLRRPDETAILVNGLPANSLAETLEDFVYRVPEPPSPEVETNFEKWLDYLRGELKKKE